MWLPETRTTRRLFLQAGLTTLAVACAASTQMGQLSPPSPNPLLDQPRGGGPLTAALPASDLAVGPNQRFLVALIGPGNQLITDATVELAFFKVTGADNAQLRSRAPATYLEPPGSPGRGIYVARTDFDEAGDWGVEASVVRPGGPQPPIRVGFKVKPRSDTPAIGQVVPASSTLVGHTVSEVESFCSARPADLEFHQLTIADAITQAKPTAILFATPGFCESMLCGPSLDSLKALRQQYGERVNYVHVEIYKDGRPNERKEMVPSVSEWGLPSEPWLFVVGPGGRLADKFEGSITVEETTPVIDRLLNA